VLFIGYVADAVHSAVGAIGLAAAVAIDFVAPHEAAGVATREAAREVAREAAREAGSDCAAAPPLASKQATSATAACGGGFPFVPRLEARRQEVALLSDGRVCLPLLERLHFEEGVLDQHFDYWMAGGAGVTVELPPQSFFIDYDDTDTSFRVFGKTYGPQRREGEPYTMRPYLVVFRRLAGVPWVADDFLANYEVRYWDYEYGYVTTPRLDVGIGLGPQLLAEAENGDLCYSFYWMQSVRLQVTKPAADREPLRLTEFNGQAVPNAQPLFRLRSGYDQDRACWQIAPLPPSGHAAPPAAEYSISFHSSMTLLSAFLKTSA